ncbi:uncharacterized protein LOC124444945 isoform X1 [Xenia sp. Carnegie-2017]|uniref:uncharacterized protein LOC124444945 isoform X1 n=1 Tax=Xenia sp. Carnegie-2017 TaxID=2897299 RepID=UPI001F045396|nr:uncharacterized protein LOC124444945 isoform X1 [Xenia sp. Carnegie-2017]XP_046851606.1 uncharacterized protein LOC124444945 isoform X1 [Xenia sp. Carnegie-2017]
MMQRKKVTFLCLTAILSTILCGQFFNHFVIQRDVCIHCDNGPEKGILYENTSPASEKKRSENSLEEILMILGNMNELEKISFGDEYEQLVEILNRIKERQNYKNLFPANMTDKHDAETAEIQEICPEKFLGKSLLYGYPFFRKGFATLNCSQFISLHKLVTLIFDDLHLSYMNSTTHEHVLRGVHQHFPSLKVIFITRNKPRGIDKIKSHVQVMNVEKDWKLGKIWTKALARVTTKYVLIGRNLAKFDDDVNLKRLIRILSHNPDVAITSGAYRQRNGYWDSGCEQLRLRNFTLTLQGGYFMSSWDCVVCDYTPGPWMARKKDVRLDKKLHFGVFRDMFMRLKEEKKIVVSCPDVMFNVETLKQDQDAWYLDFVKKHDIKKIVESSGLVRCQLSCSPRFGCKRGVAHRQGSSCSRQRGMAVPPCDLENLADAIKTVMNECEKAGLFCELQEGTLLGAVKLNKLLPWERDADITFQTANYTALKALAPTFQAAGFSVTPYDGSIWCCVDGRKAGGKIVMDVDRWKIELYGQHLMESEILVSRGEKPTKVNFAGEMITVMKNPGLFARNRYGSMLYRHQEHWIDLGAKSGWHFYNPNKFEECEKQGHSGCLNQYNTDGNLQFDINTCPCVSPLIHE